MYDKHVAGGLKLADTVLRFIQQHGLLRPGDRAGVAVSGGADSVALLRLLLEVRNELGIVLSIVHFNHKIRGMEADADQQFVADLAARYGLVFHCETGDAPTVARRRKLSLETAARELRYGYFRRLLAEGVLDKVATAHTLDDQAETVLLRLLRGTGTRGLAGIYPKLRVVGARAPVGTQPEGSGSIVRPLLGTARKEIEQYLRHCGQGWRDDASNRDLRHARNRVRHVLLPLLERDFNPAVRQVLAETAEIARAEEEYWDALQGEISQARGQLELKFLLQKPVAVQRRLVRQLAETVGAHLDFEHVEQVLGLSRNRSPGAPTRRSLKLPGGWRAAVETRQSMANLWLERGPEQRTPAYEYRLPIPGEAYVKELGTVFRVTFVPMTAGEAGYNPDETIDLSLLGQDLWVRNWAPGDRFWPLCAKGPKKVKELLQERHVPLPGRALWPVVTCGTQIIWLRGFSAAEGLRPLAGAREAVLIQELPSG